MTRSGLAKGANKGHITEQRERVARPSQSKGVSVHNSSSAELCSVAVAGGVRL